MVSYGYEAIDAAGKPVKGSIEADNMEKARSDLKSQGMTIMSLKEQSLLTRDLNIEIGGKPKARDLSVFCRQFVSMIRAGVTILDALRMLTEATENKNCKRPSTRCGSAPRRERPWPVPSRSTPRCFRI